jgi:hypothetical protein
MESTWVLTPSAPSHLQQSTIEDSQKKPSGPRRRPNDPLVGVAANSHAKPAGEEPSKHFIDYDLKRVGQRLNLNPRRPDEMKIITNHTSTPVPDRVVAVAQKERLKTALQEMTSRRWVPAARDKD